MDDFSNQFDLLKGKQSIESPKNDRAVLSTFLPSFDNVSTDGDVCLIGMRVGESLCFQGTALIGCILGDCYVMNYKVKGSQTPVMYPCYSSSASSLLTIKVRNVCGKRAKSSHFPILLVDLLNKSKVSFDAIVVVKRFTHSGIQDIQTMLPSCYSIFKPLHYVRNMLVYLSKDQQTDLIKIPGFYPLLDTYTTSRPFKYDESWTDAFQQLTSHPCPIVFVTGAKNTGKSTFSKSLVNALLGKHDKVAFLETDLGQSEFTPPGFTSLNILSDPVLGPTFTHQLQPHRSIYLATTSPVKDPEAYITSITSLFKTYTKEFNTIPLIVNTHGWIKSLGFDLLMKILNQCKGTHVVCLESDGISVLRESIIPTLAKQFESPISIKSTTLNTSKISGADLRTLSVIAYFSQINSNPCRSLVYSSKIDHAAYWVFNGIMDHVPMCIPASKISIVFPYDDVRYQHNVLFKVSPEEVLHALNCTVVALVSSNGSPNSNEIPHPDTIINSSLGLVRGVYKSEQGPVIQILSAPYRTLNDISSTNMIIRGSGMELPSSLLVKDLQDTRNVPYTNSNPVEGYGSLAKRARKNLSRKRLA